MGGHFEDAVKDEGAALEEAITPVPAVILDDVVCLLLDPDIERNEGNTRDPAKEVE